MDGVEVFSYVQKIFRIIIKYQKKLETLKINEKFILKNDFVEKLVINFITFYPNLLPQ